MFDNPGAEIKRIAKTFFWIEVVLLVIGFLAMGDYLFEEVSTIIIGLICLALGITVAYLGTLILVAFGELVESNTAIKESNEAILAKLNTPTEN